MAVRFFRCAVYTRKSTEDGLEQDFNSLHAQREACEAYIRSQASEGWQQIKGHYDDGGISGATMERPALKLLLEHIAEGKVDIVVVYKIDRLTRSLTDFAKLVERFDAAGCSFVSVPLADQPISDHAPYLDFHAPSGFVPVLSPGHTPDDQKWNK